MTDWLDDYADSTGTELYCIEPRDLYDAAIVGVADETVVYDRQTVIKILMGESDMSFEDALEYHYFNQDGANLWLFLDRPENEQDNACPFPAPVRDPSLN